MSLVAAWPRLSPSSSAASVPSTSSLFPSPLSPARAEAPAASAWRESVPPLALCSVSPQRNWLGQGPPPPSGLSTPLRPSASPLGNAVPQNHARGTPSAPRAPSEPLPPPSAAPESAVAAPCAGDGAAAEGGSSRAGAGAARAGSTAGEAGSVDASWQYQVSLGNIRGALMRQEDSIIFSLIERAQFHLNAPAYSPDPAQGGIAVPGFQGSLLEYVMRETEALHGKVRRYTSPTERPFFPEAIPSIILPALQYPRVLHPCASGININPLVWSLYFDELLPAIAAAGDDYNYGSAVTSDVLCLQALSKRIHYGVFVAEAKFLEAPETFTALIKAQDAEGILELLTKPAVEAAVLRRVEAKAAAFGQDIDTPSQAHGATPSAAQPSTAADSFEVSGKEVHADPGKGEKRYKVEPRVVAELYGRWIMPLTKQVQVDYLLRRLDAE